MIEVVVYAFTTAVLSHGRTWPMVRNISYNARRLVGLMARPGMIWLDLPYMLSRTACGTLPHWKWLRSSEILDVISIGAFGVVCLDTPCACLKVASRTQTHRPSSMSSVRHDMANDRVGYIRRGRRCLNWCRGGDCGFFYVPCATEAALVVAVHRIELCWSA